MDIPQVLKAARAAKGWSQRKLAQEMKVSAGAVGQWENGVNFPTIGNRVDLAKKLGIPFRDLLVELQDNRHLLEADREAMLLIEQFLRLPQPVREAILMQVAGLVSSLESIQAPAPANKPAPRSADETE